MENVYSISQNKVRSVIKLGSFTLYSQTNKVVPSLTWNITRTNIRVPTANREAPASNVMT
jgi:hypothetical protein